MTSWRGARYPGQSTLEEEEVQEMSNVKWCDKGDHPFSVKDVNKQHFVNTHSVAVPTGNSYGRATYQEREEVTEEIDICGPCWLSNNPFTNQEPTAIETVEADAEESASEMWQRKYEAEHERVKSLMKPPK
jgi:hypothetical protein